MSDICTRSGCTAGCIVQWKDFADLRFLKLLNQVWDSVSQLLFPSFHLKKEKEREVVCGQVW